MTRSPYAVAEGTSPVRAVCRILGLCVLLWGCGDDGKGSRSPSSPADETSEPQPQRVDPAGSQAEPPPPPPEPERKRIEAMSDKELETACFDGRQAACDRLGH